MIVLDRKRMHDMLAKAKDHPPELKHSYDMSLFHFTARGGQFKWKSNGKGDGIHHILQFYHELLTPSPTSSNNIKPIFITVIRQPAARTRYCV